MDFKNTLRTAGDYALDLIPVVGMFHTYCKIPLIGPNTNKGCSRFIANCAYQFFWGVYIFAVYGTRELNPIEQYRVGEGRKKEFNERSKRLDKIIDKDGDGNLSMQEIFNAWRKVNGKIIFCPLSEEQEDALLEGKE